MALATYKRGEVRTILHTAGADIAVDEILVIHNGDALAARVCVAREAIANGAVGVVAISGVFEFPKVSGAVIAAGECVNWDTSAGAVDDNAHTTAAGDVKHFGCAMVAAGNGVAVLDVDIAHPGAYDAA
jgi:predicted RecA/RadA family phage recombinase